MDAAISSLFKVLGDENRLKVFSLVAKGEKCGCTLIDKLSITQPTLSYHLRTLTDSGLIDAKKDGVWKKHSVNYQKVDELITFLIGLKN